MRDYLEGKGYKLWKTDKDEFGETNKYSKTLKDFQPSCELNEHVSLHITHSIWRGNDINVGSRNHQHTSVEISLVHERKGNEWCNFDIYALTEEQLMENLDKYENNLLELWTLFYNQSE